MLISIVIPAYNAAKYLNRCIESVANQDLPCDCYEAIVVNDGSTDDTEAILDSLCHKHSFLKYVSTPNGGLSRARNRGMDEASGEFLIFLDSDDSLLPHVLKGICNEMSCGRLDMMLMKYQHISIQNTLIQSPYPIERNRSEVMTGREFLLNDCYPPMVWSYVYKRNFLNEHKLSMLPIWHEDEEFTPRALYWARRVKYNSVLFYNYFQNKESYMNHYQESNLLNMIAAMSSLNKFSHSLKDDPEIRNYFDDHIAVIIMRLFKNSIRQGGMGQKALIQKIKEGGLMPLKPFKSSFYYRLFNFSPILFEKYYRFIKRKPKI